MDVYFSFLFLMKWQIGVDVMMMLKNGDLFQGDKNLTLKRVNAAMTARKRCKSEWGKNYWDSVIAYLLRKANRLN